MRRRWSVSAAPVAILAFVLVAAFAAPSAALAADPDPAAGFDATWTVTRPDGTTIRDDGSIAVGDDLELAFTAVDGTAATRCRVAVYTADASINVPGRIDAGVCRLSMRLPDLPSPAWRALWAPPDRELCVAATLWFTDDLARNLAPGSNLEPGGDPCGPGGTESQPKLDFHIDEAGATDRPFTSDPPFVSWDPADWGTDMQPLRFGETFRFAMPDWIDQCEPMINGTWQTTVRPMPPPDCGAWEVRIPGVLPAAFQFVGDDVWHTSLAANYYVPGSGEPYSVVSFTTVPLAPTDGVFESNRPAVFPIDLASTRFVTIGEPWTPVYQVSGIEATGCRMTTYDNQGNDAGTYEVPIDADDRCTFDHPALVKDERHQYHVIAIPESDPTSQLITFGGSIESIAAPEPPVIDPPTPEAGGDTGIDVEPGAGQGMVVDLDVAPASAMAGASFAAVGSRVTASAGSCSDQAVSVNLEVGGAIPTLEAQCHLAPGSYVATAVMLDAAGVTSIATRSFSVAYPAPKTVTRSPVGGTAGVARDVHPTVTFDVPVSGVSGTSVRLIDTWTGGTVPATVAYDAAKRRATITPTALLHVNRTFRIALGAAIKAVTGGTPLASTSWTFKTTTDSTAPTIIGRLPGVNATGVARTTSIAVRFSEGVKGVTGSSVQLRDTVTGLYVPATVAYDATAKRASLRPTTSLVAHRKYTAIVRSSIRDLAGNPMTTASWSFTTGP